MSRSFPSLTRHKNGFTLVELLVVISIIALLVSIMLPVLANARKSGVALKCMNNVRQVNMAFYQYHMDHKDMIAGYRIPKLQASHADIYWWTVLLNRNYLQSDERPGTQMYPGVTINDIKDSMPPIRCVDDSNITRYSSQNVRLIDTDNSPAFYIHLNNSNRSRFLASYTMNYNMGDNGELTRRSASARPREVCLTSSISPVATRLIASRLQRPGKPRTCLSTTPRPIPPIWMATSKPCAPTASTAMINWRSDPHEIEKDPAC